MSVFNSLGSNYSALQVWKSLVGRGSKAAEARLAQTLGEHYGGQATLTYKGRHALEIALRRAELPAGSTVAINGFTCFVVYQAVQHAGYTPLMLDVASGSLDFGIKELEAAHAKTGSLQAIIVQNTLGQPVDMPVLEAYCRQHNLLIIEDLAHSLGAEYADGREAGTVGDLVMLSFSQDKPLDVVAGGACIDRRAAPGPYEVLPRMRVRQALINRWYPFWTALIRLTYAAGAGRVLHRILKQLHLLATPMSDNLSGLYAMTGMSRGLLPGLWRQRATILAHRRRIAAIYQKALPQNIQYESAGQSASLRFPVRVADRAGLVASLKRQHIYVGDTWYDAPIAPKRYLARTDYQAGQCPEAERLAAEIVNLPTHRHVSETQAQQIAAKVNEWLASR